MRPENHDMTDAERTGPAGRSPDRRQPGEAGRSAGSAPAADRGDVWRASSRSRLDLNPYDADGTPRTMATHTQLGMPPCNFVILTGKPCPSCGMTTSFALLVRGDVVASLRANWAGTLLAVLWAGAGRGRWRAASRGGRCSSRGRGELVLTVERRACLVLMLARWVAVLIGG